MRVEALKGYERHNADASSWLSTCMVLLRSVTHEVGYIQLVLVSKPQSRPQRNFSTLVEPRSQQKFGIFSIIHTSTMSSSPPPPRDAEHKARTKEFSREGRLSFRNFAEHQMRREFKELALQQCQEPIREFAQCAQEKGLLVVFSCRHLNKAINDCMAIHNSNEAFEKYKQEHEEELEKRTIGSK